MKRDAYGNRYRNMGIRCGAIGEPVRIVQIPDPVPEDIPVAAPDTVPDYVPDYVPDDFPSVAPVERV